MRVIVRGVTGGLIVIGLYLALSPAVNAGLGRWEIWRRSMRRCSRGRAAPLHGTIQLHATSKGLASFEGTFAVDAPGGAIGSSSILGVILVSLVLYTMLNQEKEACATVKGQLT